MFKIIKWLLPLLSALALSGCQYHVLSPQGWVGIEQRNLLVVSTLLMLVVIIPVLVMAVYFPWKYRADREDLSDYDATFEHSSKIEVLIWGVPILIVAALGWLTYDYTHKLDPYRPLDHLQAGEPVEVDAVSLDWKWLFIYPKLGIASVNELAIPAGHPINFRISSATVMNTLSIPALGGMVYSMAGMETKLHLIADAPGKFLGQSAHFSGPGFAHMQFETLAMTKKDFGAWVTKVKSKGTALTRATYPALEKPSIADPVRYYASVDGDLFKRIVEMCVAPGKVCTGKMMMQDKMGGGGMAGIPDVKAYSYDRQRAIDAYGNLVNPQPLQTPIPKTSALKTSYPICRSSAKPETVAYVN